MTTPSIPVVPEQGPGQSQILITEASSPYVGGWWTEQTVADVPGEAVGWFVANDWQITSIRYDATTTPSTPYYAMYRESFNNSLVLQTLLNSYTIAYNEARYLNNGRYNQVVSSWAEMIGSSQSHFAAETTEQNEHVMLFLGNLDTYMDDVDTLIEDNTSELVEDAARATSALTQLNTKLGDLETNADTSAETIRDLLQSQVDGFNAFAENYATKVGELDSNYSDRLETITTLLSNATDELSSFVEIHGTRLGQLETAQGDLQTDVNDLLSDEVESLGTHLLAYAAELAKPATHGDTTRTDVGDLLSGEIESLGTYAGEYGTELEVPASHGDTTRTEVETLIGSKVTALTDYLLDYVTSLGAITEDLSNLQIAALATQNNANTRLSEHLIEYGTHLTELGDNYTDHADALDTLIEETVTNANTFTADVVTIIGGLSGEYDAMLASVSAFQDPDGSIPLTLKSHAEAYNEVLGALSGDYDDHVEIAAGFLNDLGGTELARINEAFNATLSTQLQQLTDRGLYSGAAASDITARNTRDRNEEIAALNDRLNREKLENQHKLYGQQTDMRSRTMEGLGRIHGVQQEVYRYLAAQVVGTYSLLQEFHNRTIAGKQTILSVQEASSKFQIAMQSELYAKINELRLRLMEAADRSYQLRDALAKWINEETHRLFTDQLQIHLKFVEAEQLKYAAKQEVYSSNAATWMQSHEQLLNEVRIILGGLDSRRAATADVAKTGMSVKQQLHEHLMNEVRIVLDGLDRERAATSDVAKFGVAVKEKIFAAIQGVLSQIIDGIQKKLGLSVDVWRGELTQRDKMLEQLQQITAQHLDGLDKQHSAQLDVTRVASSAYDQLLGQLQDAVKGILNGKERYAALTMQNASTLAEHKHRAITEKMSEYAARLEGLRGKNTENMALMKYQLDERNKLLIGLYEFVEKREDEAPKISEFGNIIAKLGEAGWATP